MSKDKNGFEYAKVDAVKAGDVLVCDDGFTCIVSGAERIVLADKKQELYISCGRNEAHYLHGQIKDDYYVGLYPKATAPTFK